MSKIFELFGYRIDQWSNVAEENRSKALCPFMGQTCDGGGNRYSSGIELHAGHRLAEKFPGLSRVQSGVCSLQLKDGEQPWIVCPRRLLTYKNSSDENFQDEVKNRLRKFIHNATEKTRVWSEVKMKISTVNSDEDEKYFDYTFDYVTCQSARTPVREICKVLGIDEKRCLKIAQDNDYTTTVISGEKFIDDYPAGEITIIEIMTSSTSGGDKKKRTQVAMAFEDAVLHGSQHNGPGINYRQVWARMVSQLIVKSEVAIAWKGKTIWVVQDLLSDYISESTALDLKKYLSDRTDEVNILSCGYGDSLKNVGSNVIQISDVELYSGPIAAGSKGGGFVDIVRIGAPPPVEFLYASLFRKRPGALR